MNGKRKENTTNTRGVLLTAGSMFALMCGAADAQEFRGIGAGEVTGVSADGTAAVGYGANSSGDTEAFYWTSASGMIGLGDLPGGIFETQAWAVSADGSVVVGQGISAAGVEAFRWEAGVMTGLGMLPGTTQSYASGVSADGSVVVGSSYASLQSAPFRWEGGVMTSLGTLGGTGEHSALGVSADGSVVTGFSENTSGFREAFRWTQTDGMVGLGFLPGWNASEAVAISADGRVIIGSGDGVSVTEQAFRWTEGGGIAGLGFLPGDNRSGANAVNADGSVIVGFSAIEGDNTSFDAFYWTQSDGMRALADVLAADGVDTTGWRLEEATGVSANGLIVVGHGLNPGSTREGFWVRLLQRPPASPDFDVLVGHNNVDVYGVSGDGGTVVGGRDVSGGKEAFAWTGAGGFVGLGDLAGGQLRSEALGANADGTVIVGFGTTNAGQEAFRWTGGVMTGLGLLSGDERSRAEDVSLDGAVVVGSSIDVGGNPTAFRWIEGGGMTSLGTLGGGDRSAAFGVGGDGTIVVGWSTNNLGYARAFRWTEADGMVALDVLSGHNSSIARAISADGVVIVGESSNGAHSEAFRWTQGGGMVGLGFLPGDTFSRALDVNGDGSVVVGYSDGSDQQAFYWTAADNMRSLADVLAAEGVNLGGWELHSAEGVSADGSIVVGMGESPDGDRGGFWARIAPASPPPPPPPGDFQSLTGRNLDIYGISGDGFTVVGSRSNINNFREAFAWTPSGGFVFLGDLPGGSFFSRATAASADGSVIVGNSDEGPAIPAFRWEGGVMTALPLLAGMTSASPSGVSADGSVIVGSAYSASSDEAFRWTQATGTIGLGGLGGDSAAYGVSADGSVIVGSSVYTPGLIQAFRWTEADGMIGLGFLPGGAVSDARAISADGTVIVGWSGPDNNTYQAFRWTTADGMVGLGTLTGDMLSAALDVNGDGSVVVGESGNGSSWQAFYWTTSSGMESLEDVLASQGVNLGGLTLLGALGVSDDGTIVIGYAQGNGDQTGFWARIAPASPPPPPGGGNPPPPGSGLLSESVLERSALSTSAVLSSAIAGANLDGAMQMSGASGTPRDVQLAMLTGDAPLPAESRNRPGELRAFVLGGSSNYNGDITSAENADATWGLSYQATREIRIGGALRYMTFDGDLPAFAGRAELEGHVLQGFAAYERGSQGPRIHVAAAAGQSDANIDRGYLNGATPEISRGERDGEFYSAAIKAGWRVPVTADASLTPFVRYDVARVELDGYTETGGTFPARFDPIDDTVEIARLGVEGGMALARGVDFEGALAWGHRFDEYLSPISGEVIGLTPFYYAGARVEPDWTEASAAIVWSASDGVNVRFGVGASTDGDTTPDLSAALGVSMRM